MGNSSSELRRKGFGRLGPVADTEAAAWQSNLGNVPRGHKFGDYQRRGMREDNSCTCGKLFKWIIILGIAYVVYHFFLQEATERWYHKVAEPWLTDVALPWFRDSCHTLSLWLRMAYVNILDAVDKLYKWFAGS